MTRTWMAVMWLVVAAWARSALGDGKPPATQPPKPAPVISTEAAMDRVIPEVNFQNVSLEDAMSYLQDTIPDFHAVVLRDAGVPQEYPALRFAVKKANLAQVLELIQMTAPEMEQTDLPGGGGTIHVFKLHAQAAEPNPAGLPGPFGPAAPGGVGAPASASAGVHVYRLTEVVEGLLARGKGPWEGEAKEKEAKSKEALNNVLSLIKATLAQTDGGEAPVLQVHEETQTLIFKGRENQRAAIEDVLTALQPTQSAGQEQAKLRTTIESLQRQVDEERKRAAESVDQAKVELQNLRVELQSREKEYRDQAVELDRLRARLEDVRKETKKQ